MTLKYRCSGCRKFVEADDHTAREFGGHHLVPVDCPDKDESCLVLHTRVCGTWWPAAPGLIAPHHEDDEDE